MGSGFAGIRCQDQSPALPTPCWRLALYDVPMQLSLRSLPLFGLLFVCIGLLSSRNAHAGSARALGSAGEPEFQQSTPKRPSVKTKKELRSIPKGKRESRRGLRTFGTLDRGGIDSDLSRLTNLSIGELGGGVLEEYAAKRILVTDQEESTLIEGRFHLPLNLPLDTKLDLVAVKSGSNIRYPQVAGRAGLGPDGSFRIRIPRGDRGGWLKLAGGNLVFKNLPRYTVKDGVPTLWGDFAPKVGGVLRVRVKDEDGHDIPWVNLSHFVQVEALQRQLLDMPRRRPRWDRIDPGRHFPTMHLIGPLLSSSSGEIKVQCDGYVESFHAVDPDLIRLGEITDMDIVLRPEIPIEVTVVNRLGEVQPDAQVSVADAHGSDDSLLTEHPLFGEARSFFGRGPGTYSARVSGEGLQAKTVSFSVPAETKDTFEVEVIVDLQLGIQGRVEWPDGSPVAGAKIRVRPFVERSFSESQDPKAYPRFFVDLGEKGKRTKTDKRGRFQVLGFEEALFFEVLVTCPPQDLEIPAGMSRSKVRALERRSEQYSIQAPVSTDGQPITIVVGTASQGVHGRVVDDRGTALQEFEVEAYPGSDGELLQRSLNLDHLRNTEFGVSVAAKVQHSDGRFELGKLQAGEWCLKLSAPGFVSKVQRDVKSGEQEHLIVMERVSSLRGRVVGPDGVVPEEVRIRVSPESGLSVTREQDAEFLWSDLAPGEYEVVAYGSGFGGSEPQTVTLRAGETSPILELRLCKLGSIQGRVGDRLTGMGWPLIVLVGQDALPVELRPDGSFIVEGVSPGTYELDLAISSSGKRPEALRIGIQATVHVKAGEVSQTELNAEPESVVVTGRITDDNEPASFGSLYFETTDRSRVFAAPIDKKGRYSALLPPEMTFNVFLGFHTENFGGDEHFWLHMDWVSPKVQGQEDWDIPFARMQVELVDESGAPFQWFKNKPPIGMYYFPEREVPAFMLLRATEPDGSIDCLLPGGHYMLGTASFDSHGRYAGVLAAKFTVPLDGSIGVIKAVVKTMNPKYPGSVDSDSADPLDGGEQE